MSQITTHVLDTALGKPAAGVPIALQEPMKDGHWVDIASDVTNSDGRIPDLLPADLVLKPGVYRMVFSTGAYFKSIGAEGFYPEVPVIFEIKDTDHYHIPLLLNPFGYSTYRGS